MILIFIYSITNSNFEFRNRKFDFSQFLLIRKAFLIFDNIYLLCFFYQKYGYLIKQEFINLYQNTLQNYFIMFPEYQKQLNFFSARKKYFLQDFKHSFIFKKNQRRKRSTAIYLNNLQFDQQKQLEQHENSESLFIDWFSDGSKLFESTRTFCFKLLSINVEKLFCYIDIKNFLNSFTNLEILELKIPYQYLIEEQEAFYLGEGLKVLTSLQILTLEIPINQRGAELFGDSLSQLKKLQSIKIKLANYEYVGGLGIQRICQGILASKQQLKFLSLQIGYFNEIGQLGAQSIAKCIRELNLLEFLNLNIKKYNGLDMCELSDIYESIQSRKFLKCLVLKQTANTYLQIKELQNQMICKESLQQLYLNLDQKYENSISLYKSLHQFVNLQELIIKFYSYQQEDIIQFTESLEYLKNIKILILRSKGSQSFFQPKKVLQFPLKKLSQLVFFHLDYRIPNLYHQPSIKNLSSCYKSKRLVMLNIT
ncbi:hypothetical protein ABPG74_016191 [Tetrahymena malaccensis]